MKITKTQLKQIIKEEMTNVQREIDEGVGEFLKGVGRKVGINVPLPPEEQRKKERAWKEIQDLFLDLQREARRGSGGLDRDRLEYIFSVTADAFYAYATQNFDLRLNRCMRNAKFTTPLDGADNAFKNPSCEEIVELARISPEMVEAALRHTQRALRKARERYN